MFNFLSGLFSSHYFSQVHFLLVVTHVAAALISLVVAPVAMIVSKGGKAHRQWGKVYFWGMMVSLTVAVVLLFFRFNIFLLGVTLLSGYAAISGYRALALKRLGQGQQPTGFDWSFVALITLAGVGLIVWAILTWLGVINSYIPNDGGKMVVLVILPLVFGFSIAYSGFSDLRLFRNPPTDRNWWWFQHMSGMLGSYTGLLTALMVQQVGPRMPESLAWIVWIAPTLILSPLTALWINHYRRKFVEKSAQKATVAAPAAL